MIDGDEFRQLDALFLAALDLPFDERAAMLDDACNGDLELRHKVELLIAGADRSDFLEKSAFELLNPPGSLPPIPAQVRPFSAEFTGTARFETRRQIGQGRFGTVFECHDRLHDRVVALKLLRDPDSLARFKGEFRSLVSIRHPNLVELFELHSENDSWFFTMELVHGMNFLDYVSHRPLPGAPARLACDIDRLRDAALQLARGIAALHRARILHCDIKPSNVMIADDGGLRLLDFGLARDISLPAQDSWTVAGTLAYMSLEQLTGAKLIEATDWYSFGVVLFQALTGSLPRRRLGPSMSEVQASPRSACAPDLPPDLDRLCTDLLRDDPGSRPSGSEVLERLGGSVDSMTHARAVALREEEALVGRKPHLEELKSLLQLVHKGNAVIVTVHGQSGIGKSSVLHAFRETLARDELDVVVIAGRCHENDMVPFKAIDDLLDGLSRFLKGLPQSAAEALVPSNAQYLGYISPVLAQVKAMTRLRHHAVEILDPQELRERAFVSLCDLLSRLAARHTVVLMIDDLQWGDLDSEAFIGRLFSAPSPPSLLFVASYRTEDADSSPFLRSLRSHLPTFPSVMVRALEVRALTPLESTALAARLLASGSGADHYRAASIARESTGIPFLIEQLARYEGLDSDERGPVVSIRQVVDQRMRELPAEAQRLLETIAIAGQPIACEIANAAAGLGRHDQSALSLLIADRFVRLRDTRGPREVEPYHDRIREAIVAAISAEQQKERHRSLALTLERQSRIDAPLAAIHFQSAGEREPAARYAVVAAEQAASALAFDRAARWYQLALAAGNWSGAELLSVRRKLALTLGHAGYGSEAARVYLETSREASATDRCELERLAAEQLLRVGRVSDGLELLHAVARDFGVWLPTRRWQMLASLVWHRIRIRLTRLEPSDRPARVVSARDLTLLDVYWSLVIGLATLDVARSAEFQSRHLLMSMRVGDRDRIAMALALEAAKRASSRHRNAGAVADLLSKAERLSVASTHPQAVGLIATMKGVSSLLMGDWRSAQRWSSRADAILREQCTGATWELATNHLVTSSSTFHLGEWGRFKPLAQTLSRLEEVAEQGDAHSIHAVFLDGMIACFSSDQTDMTIQLEKPILQALSASSGQGYLLPHLWLLEARVSSALYRDDPEEAWKLVMADWPALSKSLHFRIAYAAICSHYLRARAAIAIARRDAQNRTRYLGEAVLCARKLEEHPVPWPQLLAAFVRSGAASVDGQPAKALQLLEKAEPLARQTSMAHLAAACQYRRGTLLGGLLGRGLVSQAEAWAIAQRIVNPAQVFNIFAPGSWVWPHSK